MVVFVAKTLPVDNSNLTELDNFKPFNPQLMPNIGYDSRYINGQLSVTVTQNNILKYKIKKIEVEKKDINKLFKGDNWEPNLFKGDDQIKGSSQPDMLYGFNGNDGIHGNAGDDTLYGGKGKDELYGGDGVDTLFGGAGKDVLDGGGGTVNEMTGGGGKDTFAFSAQVVNGVNYSQINDFTKGVDKIELSKTVFQGIGSKGPLNSSNFVLASEYDGQSNVIIYDEANGNMHYGKEGAIDYLATPIFGRIANGVILSNTDFVIAA